MTKKHNIPRAQMGSKEQDLCLEIKLKHIFQPQDVDVAPLLTLHQLVVMALVFLGKATQRAIEKWISYHFVYYEKHGIPKDRSLWVKSKWITFAMADVPLKRSITESGNSHQWEVTSTEAARCYLQDTLLPGDSFPQGEKCHFLKLPAEIRNRIYGMVLAYPKSGVHIRPRPRQPSSREAAAFVISRNVDDVWNADEWVGESSIKYAEWFPVRKAQYVQARDVLRCPPLATHLALLAVNKQIHKEARPLFFSTNTFVCFDLMELHTLIRKGGSHAFRHIAFHLRGLDHHLQLPYSEDTFANLNSASPPTGPCTLDIYTGNENGPHYRDIALAREDIHGLETLGSILPNFEWSIHGHGKSKRDKVKIFLEQAVTQVVSYQSTSAG